MNKSKNEAAWEEIFEKYHILNVIKDSGRATISSDVINQFREARLMTKFDNESQLPALFAEHQLSIMPTSRGIYEIGPFEAFHRFDKDTTKNTPAYFPVPDFIESIDHKNITSESLAINCAYLSGILNDFTGEKDLLPTVSGRMGSSSFDYMINSGKNTFKINVENAQVEIDGGFEGHSSLSLIEAKNYIADDFLIRQLYYPYRLWRNKIKKRVRPIFLTYSNGIFYLREYEFTDLKSYNSIKLINYKKYAIQEETMEITTIQSILHNVKIKEEPEVPFPQADKFERVINLCELLKQRSLFTIEDITQNYAFTPRQAEYYSQAAIYLGLINKAPDQERFELTEEGERILSLPFSKRQLEFVRLILEHFVFHSALKLYLRNETAPTKSEIIEIMKDAKLRNIESEETYKRRASTVISWVNWILELMDSIHRKSLKTDATFIADTEE